jgi:hypothetical protein
LSLPRQGLATIRFVQILPIFCLDVVYRDRKIASASYGNELAEYRAVSFSVALAGYPKPVDAFVRDEAYRIGREALGNAFQHLGATRIKASPQKPITSAG